VGLQIVLTKSRIYEDGAICVGDAQVGGLVEKDSCAAIGGKRFMCCNWWKKIHVLPALQYLQLNLFGLFLMALLSRT
jgi:hypothetical protein